MSSRTKTPTKTTPADRLQRIRQALDELKLRDMSVELERQLDDGSDLHWLERFERLLTAQVRGRRERAIERRVTQAKFPAIKTLDNFDFDFQSGVDRSEILHLATLDWLDRRRSILLAGMSGTGKSHIAIALGHLACLKGYRVRYTTSADMLTDLHLALATQNLKQAVKPFVRCELLIIDEVGLDKPERQAFQTDDASLFYKVVAARYEATRSSIITTNIQWDEWGDYLGDEVATAAILDRLVHRSHAITIDGPSWRAHEHEQLNRADASLED